MGDIIFTAKNKITETSKSTSWIAEKADAVMQAMGLVKQKGENGVDLLIGPPPKDNSKKTAIVVNAFFARKKEDKYVKSNWGGIGEELYVVVQTIGLAGKEIGINIKEKEGILTGEGYGVLPVLQNGEDKKGAFKTTVRADNFGIFKLEMKAKDNKVTEAWKKNITASKDKKAYLCILVDAQSRNPDIKILYNGKNAADDKTSAKGDKTNYWLDNKGGWFELKRKNPIIVIDPGHGYERGSTGTAARVYTYKVQGKNGDVAMDSSTQPITAKANVEQLPQYVVDDPKSWIVSSQEDSQRPERLLALEVSVNLKLLLEKEQIQVIMTRTDGGLKAIKGTDDWKTRQARLDLASNNHADYFISIHADGVNNSYISGSHAIYNDSDSKALAIDIMKYYTIVPVEPQSPKKDERGLDVLNSSKNTTKRKVLVELGFITTPKDANALFKNEVTVAEQLKKGILENIDKHF